jgi:hypothetical protein
MLAATEPDPLLGEINVLVDSAEALVVDDDTKQNSTPEENKEVADNTTDQIKEADADVDEEDEPYVDFRLHESVRILSDLIDFNQRRMVAKHEKVSQKADN